MCCVRSGSVRDDDVSALFMRSVCVLDVFMIYDVNEMLANTTWTCVSCTQQVICMHFVITIYTIFDVLNSCNVRCSPFLWHTLCTGWPFSPFPCIWLTPLSVDSVTFPSRRQIRRQVEKCPLPAVLCLKYSLIQFAITAINTVIKCVLSAKLHTNFEHYPFHMFCVNVCAVCAPAFGLGPTS